MARDCWSLPRVASPLASAVVQANIAVLHVSLLELSPTRFVAGTLALRRSSFNKPSGLGCCELEG